MPQPVYLNIGCGKVKLPGFVNIDLEPGGDIQCDVTQGLPYDDATVDGIYSEHFIEHLSQKDIIAFLRECRRVLRPGGRVRIATPDLDEAVRQYFENDWRQPWLEKYGYAWIRNRAECLNVTLREWGHQWLVNEEELSRLANLAGLEGPRRCALNASTDGRLANLETRSESTLVMEYLKRSDAIAVDPLVSIVIPAFRSDFFATCLDSALAQTHRNLEILILDDSPSGEIEKIAGKYLRRDARIVYRRNTPPLGEPDNLTQGIRLARGEFIKPLYDDDTLEADAVERLLGAFRAMPDARLAAGRRIPIDTAGKRLDEASLGSPLAESDGRLRGTAVIGQILSNGINTLGEPTCMMFRRADALAIDEPNVMSLFGRLCFGIGDVCLALHLLSRGDLAYVAEPIAQFRLHAGQTQRQPGFRDVVVATWAYVRQQAARLGFPLTLPPAASVESPEQQRVRLYREFLARHRLAPHEAQAFDNYFASLGGAPSFEILVCHDGDEARLARTIASASRWLYDHFALTILAPGEAPAALQNHSRIAWQKVGAGGTARFWPEIRARFAASGADWLILIEAGDELVPHALLYLAEHALRVPQAVALYADEDSIDAEGRPDQPRLKPDFSPDYFLACNYPGDAVALRKTAVDAIGGIRLSDNDPLRGALLRLFARHGGAAIGHVADVLWHRHPTRRLNRQLLSGAVEPALREILPQATLSPGWLPGAARIDYPPPGSPAVLMIVEACAELAAMQRLIGNLWQNRAYAPVELVVFVAPDLPEAAMRFLQEIDSVSPPGLAIFANPPGLERTARIAAAIANSEAELILIARPDIEPTDSGWLAALAGHASRPEIGLVAPRLIDRHGRLVGNALLLGMEGFAVGLGHGESFDAPGQLGRLLTPQNPSAVSTDIVMFSRAALDAAGGFDTSLGPTAALIDLALRMRQNGRSHLWTPHVTLACLHESAEKLAPTEEAVLLERWLPHMARDPAYNINLSRKTPFSLTEHPQVSKLRLPWKPLPRLMAFPADLMGCGHYRVIEPFHAVRKAGLIDGYLGADHYDPLDMAVFEADTLLLQRQVSDAQLAFLRSYRRFFKLRLIYELDDLITNLPVENTHKGNIPKDIAKRLRQGLELCDRFIVSTEPLKEAYRDLIGDIRVVPNRLDREKWERLAPRRRTGEKPRVGWAGGISHGGDLALVIDLVKETADAVEWVFLGMCREEFRPYLAELHAGVDTPLYPDKLASLNLDLAIAPIAENHFNDCKSNLKLLEYGILGYPVIASDFGPYRRSKDFPGVTLVKNRHKDWVAALREHLADLDECARRGDALREHIRRHWILQDHLEEWRAAWFDFPEKR